MPSLCQWHDARMTPAPREVDVESLFATTSDPFVLHHVDPATCRRVWVLGDAVVLDAPRGRPGENAEGRMYTCLGPVAELNALTAHVAAVAEPPWRVRAEASPGLRLPDGWGAPDPHLWHWMVTGETPGADGAHWPVEAVADAAEVDAVLDVANSDAFARPGAPGVELWLGVRRAGRLAAVGALQRMADRTLHLRGVAVLPDERGRRLGTTLSAALTRHALRHGSGVATLGVYVDNLPAVRIYEQLGYRAVHTFSSGVVAAAAGP
jgi:ribosomal protein S18 acetylase RimI-like enzyme